MRKRTQTQPEPIEKKEVIPSAGGFDGNKDEYPPRGQAPTDHPGNVETKED